ncbi:hypothetical protein ACFC0X_05160 [Paenibacillus chitinolyticus]|uniref:hypothetical protein n=1 Tax=Paenibacillus chitinolyticus TaxID=79263 RepID=UPI0035D5800D
MIGGRTIRLDMREGWEAAGERPFCRSRGSYREPAVFSAAAEREEIEEILNSLQIQD